MLNIFTLANGRLVQEEIEALEELSKFQPIWVDLESPSLEEKRWIKQYYGLSIPEDAMDEDIEESARFYEEDNGELHIRSDFLIADDAEPRAVRVAFILNLKNDALRSKGVLFSIHDEDVPVFRLLRLRARRAPGLARRQAPLPDGRHRRPPQHQPEQDHQDLLGGQRGLAAADADRQHLRHEPEIPRAGAARRHGLPLRRRADDRQRAGAHVVLPQARLAALIQRRSTT